MFVLCVIVGITRYSNNPSILVNDDFNKSFLDLSPFFFPWGFTPMLDRDYYLSSLFVKFNISDSYESRLRSSQRQRVYRLVFIIAVDSLRLNPDQKLPSISRFSRNH